MSGKAGQYNLGILNMQTEDVARRGAGEQLSPSPA